LAWADCVNDLEGPVAARHPEIRTIVSRLRDAGAWLAAMSGSGSACFGVFDPAADVASVATGWPEGTGVWRTRLLSRAAYTEMARCLPRLSSSHRIV
jgi:4-diphosphocytidyl-2-C-methyl-D-erythritol kinase